MASIVVIILLVLANYWIVKTARRTTPWAHRREGTDTFTQHGRQRR